MEHQPHTPDPEREPTPEKITGGEPYIILEGGLVINDPGLPIIDLDLLDSDLLIDGDDEQARDLAELARGFGLHDIAQRFQTFADSAAAELSAQRLERTIDTVAADGIDAARRGGTDLDTGTAAVIALGLARALARSGSALERFARTGEGDPAELRAEYLELYDRPDASKQIRTWIDWLGIYLTNRPTPASPGEAKKEPWWLLQSAKMLILSLTNGDGPEYPHLLAVVEKQEVDTARVAVELAYLGARHDFDDRQRGWIAWLTRYLVHGETDLERPEGDDGTA